MSTSVWSSPLGKGQNRVAVVFIRCTGVLSLNVYCHCFGVPLIPVLFSTGTATATAIVSHAVMSRGYGYPTKVCAALQLSAEFIMGISLSPS